MNDTDKIMHLARAYGYAEFDEGRSYNDGLSEKRFEALREAIEQLQQQLADARSECTALREPLTATQLGGEWAPCAKLPVTVHVRHQRPGEAHVSTREGITPVKPDDLIMRGVSGEEYPIGREIFEKTYTLNTTPPAAQREPLTQDQLDWLIATCLTPASIIRAVEAAHGIGSKP